MNSTKYYLINFFLGFLFDVFWSLPNDKFFFFFLKKCHLLKIYLSLTNSNPLQEI